MTNYLSLPGIESGQAGSQDMGLSVLKLAKSQTNQDEAVGHPRELPCPSCYGPWFPVLIFLPVVQTSLWIKISCSAFVPA